MNRWIGPRNCGLVEARWGLATIPGDCRRILHDERVRGDNVSGDEVKRVKIGSRLGTGSIDPCQFGRVGMEVNVRRRPARPELAAVVFNPDNWPRKSLTAGYVNPQTLPAHGSIRKSR